MNDDVSEEEKEDYTIKPNDALIAAAKIVKKIIIKLHFYFQLLISKLSEKGKRVQHNRSVCL